jgi:hypothetical protein
MTPNDFLKVGDRVRVIESHHMAEIGALGTVKEVDGTQIPYLVLVDGATEPYWFLPGKLELAWIERAEIHEVIDYDS